MANTYRQVTYHIIFSTKDRLPAISKERRRDLFAYIWGIHKSLQCTLYRIGGVADHVHILTDLHPSVTLAKLVGEVKAGSTKWIRNEGVFPNWPGWQDGYGAFTHALSERQSLVRYINSQEEHHRKVSFLDEYRRFLKKEGVAFEERYLT